jgi:tripartite-type tricarboxylate transporter receptor subunit TctC
LAYKKLDTPIGNQGIVPIADVAYSGNQAIAAAPLQKAITKARALPICEFILWEGYIVTNVKLPHRRQFLHLAAGAAVLPAVSRVARAQAYPTRPVRIVVGFAPGGTTDIIARLVAQWLSERLGQQFIVENRPGANASIATETVVRAAPDGYTLLMCVPEHALNPSLYKLNYDFRRDMTMIGSLVRSPLVLEVHPTLPATNVPEFIGYLKANRGKVTMASFGAGSLSHVAGELFKMAAGVEAVHVPYRGSAPMLSDLIGGQVHSAFDNLPASIEHIKAGRLRPLAVATATRSEVLPTVPTMVDFVPGFEASATTGMGAPAGTPVDIINKLNSEINAGVSDPRMRARIAELGAAPQIGSPSDYAKFIDDETDKWSKVIRSANIKAE